MAQLVPSMHGVVLGGVVKVVGSNLALGSVDLQYPSVYIVYIVYSIVLVLKKPNRMYFFILYG